MSEATATEIPPTRRYAGRCWFFHQWSQWEQYDQTVTRYFQGTNVGQGIVPYQKRRCLRCGFMQQEQITSAQPS